MSPHPGATGCFACPTGLASSNLAFTLCNCEIGFYSTQANENSNHFLPCSAHVAPLHVRGSLFSVDGLSVVTCLKCPEEGPVCDYPGAVLQTLLPQEGWWRSDPESIIFHRCLQPANCVNGGCAANRVGPLCASCAEGYTQENQGADCKPCPSRTASQGGTAGFTILLIAALSVVLYGVWRSEEGTALVVPPSAITAETEIKNFTPEHRIRPSIAYNFKYVSSVFCFTLRCFSCPPASSFAQDFDLVLANRHVPARWC
jgi:hypothetical protein